ncbi:MAG TPA: CHRD domain-containing protein [Gemmatimonadaceae bacterium]|nr:CHRD domain-containing protein [Gemmatimonadaceae bacterium]
MRRKNVGIAAGVIGAVAIAFFVASCNDSTSPTLPTYTATLSAANEPGVINSTGSGTATFVDKGSRFDWTLEFNGLANVFASHIHGPCDACTTAPVMINLFLPNGNTGPAHPVVFHGEINNENNTAVSLDSLRTLFNNGKSYVNIHTTANQGGEIRGNVVRSN